MSTDLEQLSLLDLALELHPQVSLRAEPFGALAYHYGNRRLVFLRHVDVVAVARSLEQYPTLAATLQACNVEQRRWPTFVKAFASLRASDVVRER